MLVMGRREGQVIRLSGGISIMVTRIDGDEVKIGVQAPPDVKIWREELNADAAVRRHLRERRQGER